MKLPLGYRYATTYAGIRKVQTDDLGLIVSDQPAAAGAVFTTNRVQAAPVKLAQQHLKESNGKVRAILVNAGNANCATRTGEEVALATCAALAKELDAPVEQVLPASTGVIGVELDPALITHALPGLVEQLSADKFHAVARAIMTTDTRPKVAIEEVELKDGIVHIAGLTKGSGMIHPKMATTLGFIMTDAVLSNTLVRRMLVESVGRSYNRISVDGDTSTNDAVILLANGASGVKPKEREHKALQEALTHVLESLAEQIARDGEGARKLITILVEGATSADTADRLARTIANSPLVKTAIAGSDPNWGRILAAAGNAGVNFDPDKVDIYLQDVLVCRGGVAAEFSENELKHALDEEYCLIRFVLQGGGKSSTRFWTCDFTEDYIRINASYRT